MSSSALLLGRIGAAHGIKGEVRVNSHTQDPLAIASYGPLQTDRKGLTVEFAKARISKNVLIATLKGVTDRNQAELLNGVSLYIERDQLPQTDEDEFYYSDLIGLEVRLENASVLGTILGIENYGADDLLDIKLSNSEKTTYLPFTKAVVPTVRVSEGYVIAVPPSGWLDDTKRDPEDQDPEEA